MGIGYNAINTIKNNFIKNTTQRPIIGFKTNDDVDAHSYDGVFKNEQQLGGGAWIEANRTNEAQIGNYANNPNVFTCKKATNSISGVLLHSDIAVHGIGEQSGYVRAGQIFKWAGLKSGVETYLEVHTSNGASIDENAVFPIPLTADLTNGGVKVASGNDAVLCYGISNVIQDCQKLSVVSGKASWVNTLGIKVKFA